MRDAGVHLPDVRVVDRDALYARQDVEALVGPVVRRQPPRGLGDEAQDGYHGGDGQALQHDGDPPRVAGVVRGEGVVDPVDYADAEVECGELGADVCFRRLAKGGCLIGRVGQEERTYAPARLWAELSLEDGDGRVDDAEADAGHDAPEDQLGPGVGRRLEEGPGDHGHTAV